MKKYFMVIPALLLCACPAAAHEVLLQPQQFTAPAAVPPSAFDAWLAQFKQDALAAGISSETLDEAFAGTQAPLDRVIELDRRQPESTLTLEQYLTNVVTDKRIAEGRKQLAANRVVLKKIGRKYHVQPRFIVALWGIETMYGKHTGGFNAVDALATLAYDGRRAAFFRKELIDALKILEQEDMDASDLKGSWAGALGQCQFMPDTYLKYAADYGHDGRHDIWNTKADVFASIANYLHALGWDDKIGWGRPLKLPAHFNRNLADITVEKSLKQWQRLGVRKENGGRLPARNIKASLILVGDGDDAVPYIVYGNYKALLKWNRSTYFATSVGMLADRIGKPR